MLVLTRKAGTRLVIDGNIEVTIVKVGRGRVKLGIKAPPEVPVRRRESSACTSQSQAAR